MRHVVMLSMSILCIKKKKLVMGIFSLSYLHWDSLLLGRERSLETELFLSLRIDRFSSCFLCFAMFYKSFLVCMEQRETTVEDLVAVMEKDKVLELTEDDLHAVMENSGNGLILDYVLLLSIQNMMASLKF